MRRAALRRRLPGLPAGAGEPRAVQGLRRPCARRRPELDRMARAGHAARQRAAHDQPAGARGAVQAAHRDQAGAAHGRAGLGGPAGRPGRPAPHAGGRHRRPASGWCGRWWRRRATHEAAMLRALAPLGAGGAEEAAGEAGRGADGASAVARYHRGDDRTKKSPRHARHLPAAGLLPVLGLPADPDQDHRGRSAAAVAGRAALRRRHRRCCGCGALARGVSCSSATARCAPACWRARCSPASSPASTWGCATPRPRGSRCSSTPRPSSWPCCCRAWCRPRSCGRCNGSGW